MRHDGEWLIAAAHNTEINRAVKWVRGGAGSYSVKPLATTHRPERRLFANPAVELLQTEEVCSRTNSEDKAVYQSATRTAAIKAFRAGQLRAARPEMQIPSDVS